MPIHERGIEWSIRGATSQARGAGTKTWAAVKVRCMTTISRSQRSSKRATAQLSWRRLQRRVGGVDETAPARVYEVVGRHDHLVHHIAEAYAGFRVGKTY